MDDESFDTFICEYPFDGGVWIIEIKAASFHDAEARMKAIQSGTVKGRVGTGISFEPVDESGGEQRRH